jgi:hypothetical protein
MHRIYDHFNIKSMIKILIESQAPVAHACDPSYSEGRDQQEHG